MLLLLLVIGEWVTVPIAPRARYEAFCRQYY